MADETTDETTDGTGGTVTDETPDAGPDYAAMYESSVAKISQLEAQLAAANEANVALKAHNYDLLQSGAAEPGAAVDDADADGVPDVIDGDVDPLDALFEDEEI